MKIHRIVGESLLAPFRPDHDARPALDAIAARGANLVRLFCGPLPWASQTRESVYSGLPSLLQACADRGLNAYLSYCTEAGTGYSTAGHCSDVEAIAREPRFSMVVLREVANEPWHPTQGGRLGVSQCEALGAILRGARGYGAAEDDESLDYAGGDFVPVHLDRGRDKWNMVRRVREVMGCSEATGKPAFNQEPIGAAEHDEPGRRCADPDIHYTMGALNRLMEVGGVFHSEDGLWARPLGPRQTACAEAFHAGSRIIPPTADRLSYRNVGHQGSPVVSATFNDGDLSKPGCTRAYSGVLGGEAWTVELGCAGPSTLVWAAQRVELLSDRGTVRVYHVVL